MKRNSYFILFLIFCRLLQAQNQPDALTASIKDANAILIKADSNLVFPNSSVKIFPFNYTLKKSNDVNKALIRLKEIQAKELKQDFGLVFKATTNYNFRDVFDEQDNSFNRLRFRTELEWNILKNGLIHNRTKALQKYNDIENLKLQRNAESKQIWKRQFRVDYNYIANKEYLKLFSSFLSFENDYFDILNKLYTENYIKRERIIAVSNQIYVIKNQIETLKKSNELIKDSVSIIAYKFNELPIFSIRLDSLRLTTTQYNNEFLKKNIELKNKPLNDLSLSIYANQNFNYSLNRSQYFPAVGIRFRAPLRFNKRKERIKAQLDLLTAKENDKSSGHYNRIITHTNSYNEKLKDLQNQHKNWQIIEEKIRIFTLLKNELDDPKTGLLILELTEEKFKILENIIQIKKQLYTSIAHLFEMYPKEDLYNMLQPYFFKDYKEQQSVKFTKDSFYSLEFQYQFIITKPQYTIVVEDKDQDVKEFLKKKNLSYSTNLETSTITIARLISDKVKNLQ